MLTANNAASKARKSNKPKKGPYAKNARAGDTVHAQGNKVTNRAQLKRWFGSQADDHCFTGVVEEVVVLRDNNSQNVTYYDVFYPMPDGTTKFARNKNISHYPGPWVNPKPRPSITVHGGVVATEPMDSSDETTVDPTNPNPITPHLPPLPASIPPVITTDDVSINMLLDDPVSPYKDSQDSTGTERESVVDEEEELRPMMVPHFNKPVFKNKYDWFTVEDATDDDTNGAVPKTNWRFIANDDEYMEANDDPNGEKRTPLDYFLATMPSASLKRILAETNKKLVSREASTMDLPELFRFFGICILITRFQFEKRHDLWSVSTGSQYVPAPNFGSTGMSRNRFDEIWSVITFSAHEPEIPEGMLSPDF
jgi:Transposase IS4